MTSTALPAYLRPTGRLTALLLVVAVVPARAAQLDPDTGRLSLASSAFAASLDDLEALTAVLPMRALADDGADLSPAELGAEIIDGVATYQAPGRYPRDVLAARWHRPHLREAGKEGSADSRRRTSSVWIPR